MDSRLDAQERDYLESYERDEWRALPNLKQEMELYQAAAQSQLEGMIGIEIYLAVEDLEAIQSRASEAGVPYTSLISKIVHKFANTISVER